MAYRLGIDLGDSLTLAAYLSDGEVRLLPLVDGAAALTTIAHVSAGGGVIVGVDARQMAESEPAGLVEAPLEFLDRKAQVEINGQRVTGEVLATKMLEAVLATAVSRFGSRPERTVISHPATWVGTSTANLMAAANRSGLQNVSLIPRDESEIIATTIAGDDSGIASDYLGAYGAAVLASKALDDGLELTQPVPMPLVTIEDIDGAAPELAKRHEVIESIYEPQGPATVFTEDDEPHPPARAAQPSPAVVHAPTTAPQRPPAPAVPPAPSRTGWYTAIGIVAAAVIAAAAYLLFFVSDDAVTTSAEVSSSIPVAAETTTTAEAVPTTPAPTTTSTTSTSTTTSSTTTTSTTTTTLPELARPGLVALSGLGLVLEPGTGAESNMTFGFDADEALARIAAVAGTPDSDSGWINDEFCSAPEVRIVSIGDLELIFAGDAADGTGRRSFEQWFVAGDDRRRPENLVGRLGAGVGVSLADMSAIYGDRFDAKVGTSAEGLAFFQLDDAGPISGAITGLDPDDTLINLSAGLTCSLGD